VGIVTLDEMCVIREHLRREGRALVFANGCFDLLHQGHVEYLDRAKKLGDVLVVALNSDASVRWLNKGPGRPIISQEARASCLAALRAVDYVFLFEEETPLQVITALVPDVLVKGADWPVERIVGREVVEHAGGRLVTIPFSTGWSTTEIVNRIRERTHDAVL
jgi:D-glycero-beta-D-manno-heptose 1-phosphate adenylyltransferase